MRFRGISEVPLDTGDAGALRRFLVDVREQLLALRADKTPPSVPSGLVVTGLPFANLVQWTRGANAIGTEVLWNTTPTLNGAHIVDVSFSAQWLDYVGASGAKRYYWVRSYAANGLRSLETASMSATTQQVGTATGTAPPAPPTASQQMTKSGSRGYPVPAHPQRVER